MAPLLGELTVRPNERDGSSGHENQRPERVCQGIASRVIAHRWRLLCCAIRACLCNSKKRPSGPKYRKNMRINDVSRHWRAPIAQNHAMRDRDLDEGRFADGSLCAKQSSLRTSSSTNRCTFSRPVKRVVNDRASRRNAVHRGGPSLAARFSAASRPDEHNVLAGRRGCFRRCRPDLAHQLRPKQQRRHIRLLRSTLWPA